MNVRSHCESIELDQAVRTRPTATVLLPSWRRPKHLARCLQSLAAQTISPLDVVIVWQSDDKATRDLAISLRHLLPCGIRIVHSPEPGVVPAENTALSVASGDIV